MSALTTKEEAQPMTCRSCRYWAAFDYQRDHYWDKEQCRRHAPTVEMVVRLHDSHGIKASWPETAHNYWCGDWEQYQKGAFGDAY